MGVPLTKLTIRGFKSIQNLDDFALGPTNILIGANGAGKSNLVDFFRMLHALAIGGFQRFVINQGGGDGFLFLGPKETKQIKARLVFGSSRYGLALKPTATGTLQVSRETVRAGRSDPKIITSGGLESNLAAHHGSWSLWESEGPDVLVDVYHAITDWRVFHFHDTSATAGMRRDQKTRDGGRLRSDGSNLAAYLLGLRGKRPDSYRLIRDTIRLIAPFFADFLLRPIERGMEEQVRLEWQQKGSDYPLQPHQLSDGTIRFICLATVLLQPDPPATIIIDEPELGLHPSAIAVLSGLIESAATRTQVIISTQSPELLDYFDPADIVVVNRQQGASIFQRLDPVSLREWLDDYSIGELWQKNVVRGGPTHE